MRERVIRYNKRRERVARHYIRLLLHLPKREVWPGSHSKLKFER
jgi:hypothetical protein